VGPTAFDSLGSLYRGWATENVGQGLVTAIAILLRHQRAREIAKTQRPRPLMNAVPLGPVRSN